MAEKPESRIAMYAALRAENPHTFVPQPYRLKIEVRVNVHGQLMLLHDEPFDAIPLWVKYYSDIRMLEMLFEDGYAWPIDFDVSDSLHSHIDRSAKINLIRLENNNVVEAWETILLNTTYGI